MARRITSPQNPRVQSARRLLRRAHRDRDGAFLIEGPKVIAEALASGIELRDLFVTERALEEGAIPSLEETEVPIWLVGDDVLELISGTSTPQGAIAVAADPCRPIDPLTDHDLVLVLASLRDPGNAGTLVRSAVGAGAGGVVFTRGTVDPLSPKVVRSTAGALFHVDVTRGVTLEETVTTLRDARFQVIGTDADAGTAPEEIDMTGRVAFILGNEAWGLPEDEPVKLDVTVGIPMPGPAESLNVSVAGSILLFEAVRQRRTQPAKVPD